MLRKIIHIDMDAFFASVEQRDNPQLRGKPVVVGFDGPRGVVSTASYEARQFGIHSAMSMAQARRRCPDLIVMPSHFEKYKEVSTQVHEMFHDYTDIIEPLSLDEAFLDVTNNKPDIALAIDIALEIKQKIFKCTKLTASAGVSYCKFLAKIASDWRKPNGLTTIHPERAQEFIDKLPIEKFWGVGPRTAERMHQMGIFNGNQLRNVSLAHLTDIFGKAGSIYYNFSRGQDERPVVAERKRKSVGCEQTFIEDLTLLSQVIIELYHITIELANRITRSKFEGRTLTLKIKYADFTQITRSVTQSKILRKKEQILPLAKKLIYELSIGNSFSNKIEEQLSKNSSSSTFRQLKDLRPIPPIRLLGLAVSHSSTDETIDEVLPRWFEGNLSFDD